MQRQYTRIPIVDRFWPKVDRSGGPDTCWLWLGGINSTGRGIFTIDNRAIHAHRVAYALLNGPIPTGQILRHTCHNGLCCNPRHLIPGTVAENVQDRVRRQAQGIAVIRAIRGGNARPWALWHGRSFEQRFWDRVLRAGPDECWLWIGPLDRDGYGHISRKVRLILVHRASYELTHGPIPRRASVLHRCDRPACVNPAHLWLGTIADNNADKEAKRRGNHPKGAAHGQAKLTEAQVVIIRQEYATGGITQAELARKHGVIQITISRILRRETWTHI